MIAKREFSFIAHLLGFYVENDYFKPHSANVNWVPAFSQNHFINSDFDERMLVVQNDFKTDIDQINRTFTQQPLPTDLRNLARTRTPDGNIFELEKSSIFILSSYDANIYGTFLEIIDENIRVLGLPSLAPDEPNNKQAKEARDSAEEYNNNKASSSGTGRWNNDNHNFEHKKGALLAGCYYQENNLSLALAEPTTGQCFLRSRHHPDPIPSNGDATQIIRSSNILGHKRENCYKYDHDSEFISFNARDIKDFYNIFIDEDHTKFDDRIYLIHLVPNSRDHNVITCNDCNLMDRPIGKCRSHISTLFNILPEDVPAYSVICPSCASVLITEEILPPLYKIIKNIST